MLLVCAAEVKLIILYYSTLKIHFHGVCRLSNIKFIFTREKNCDFKLAQEVVISYDSHRTYILICIYGPWVGLMRLFIFMYQYIIHIGNYVYHSHHTYTYFELLFIFNGIKKRTPLHNALGIILRESL